MVKTVYWIGTFVLILLLMACQNQTTEETTNASAAEDNENESSPERAVSLNQHVTEIMLALDLEERMVGTAYLDDEILPELRERYESVDVLADQYPSKEVLLEVDPDFVYAGWESAFSEEGVGSQDELASYGIDSYLHQSSNMIDPSMEDIYEDIEHIGDIFHVQARAEELIAEMERDLTQIQGEIPDDQEKKQVFVYDSGEEAPFTAAQNIFNTVIELAGAENIFQEIEKGWATVNWEDVAQRNPDHIVVVEYGDTSSEQKINFLKNHDVIGKLEAVQNERFTVIPLSEASEGIRTPMALEKLVDGLYHQ